MNRQTTLAKNDDFPRQWRQVDASGEVLGRLAVRLAVILMGKDKPHYTPHCDVGDFVVVTNAERIILTGSKLDQKVRQTFSGYSGGRKTYSYRWMLENKPELLLEDAVRRMLPKNRIGSKMLKKLKIYKGQAHPHQAQQPQALTA